MNAMCSICNTYYSVRQTRGTKLSELRCRKDNGSLILISHGSGYKTMKDKDGYIFTYLIPLISGTTILTKATL